jgi:hypothetical protein
MFTISTGLDGWQYGFLKNLLNHTIGDKKSVVSKKMGLFLNRPVSFS